MSDNHELEITRTISAPVNKVFNAWLDIEGIKRWMCPGEGVYVANPMLDAKVGGAFNFTMNVDGKLLEHVGEYRIIDPPNTLEFSWCSPGTHQLNTLVSIDFKVITAEQTQITIHHKMLPDEQSRNNHSHGWSRILECLSSDIKQ